MNYKKIKQEGHKNFRRNYFQNVITIFLALIILGSGYLSSSFNNQTSDRFFSSQHSQIIKEFSKNIIKIKKDVGLSDYSKGVISSVINYTTKNQSLVFNLLNSFNKLFKGNIYEFVISLVATIFAFAFFVLIRNAATVGKNRYFLEERRYSKTNISKLLFPYRVKKTIHIAWILFVKSIYQSLWNLTIIGGFIKHYEYYFIPYVLAENPNINLKEAFRLSKELSDGQKFNLFKLDLSFIPYYVLAAFSFNLTNVFYFDGYKECVYAEIYMDLRKNKYDKLTDKKLLNDIYLDIPCIKDEKYPEEKFSIPIVKRRTWLKADYKRDYSIENYILFFFSFSFLGYAWEVFLHLVNNGEFVNRGTMYGPWLPIYGFGGILILILLKRYRDTPWKMFLSSFILCGIIEYSSAWYLETFKHMRYWDYSGYFLNIQGRICLEGLLFFGLGGCGFTYILAPILDDVYNKIKPKIKRIICVILILLYSYDFVISTIYPNKGKGITTDVVERSFM